MSCELWANGSSESSITHVQCHRPERDEEHDQLASIYDGRVWELENVADARLAIGGSFYNE